MSKTSKLTKLITAQSQESLLNYYQRVRHDTELLCEPLEIEDFVIQTMPEVSPPKWHLAHTSWYFETLLLKPFYKNYKEFNEHYAILFNSYYDTIGRYHPRHRRGVLARPTVKEIMSYREFIDTAMHDLLSQTNHSDFSAILSLTILGLNHEQQHQELLLTDIKHIFASNPLRPIYKKSLMNNTVELDLDSTTHWLSFSAGVKHMGNDDETFSYDNELPRHKCYVDNFQLASKPVTNAEYLLFINAGGYQTAEYWLSDGWQKINQQQWQAPLYWEKKTTEWYYMTLGGMKPVALDAPVCHVSYYEAMAYTRWLSLHDSAVRLPTESEWEVAAAQQTITGNLRESLLLQPIAPTSSKTTLQQMFGDVWEWTQSAYSTYPGYYAEQGPLGEYNGKFMSNQMVLRGGSCATAIDHIRASYRNFFYPHERWQFSGFRLARNVV